MPGFQLDPQRLAQLLSGMGGGTGLSPDGTGGGMDLPPTMARTPPFMPGAAPTPPMESQQPQQPQGTLSPAARQPGVLKRMLMDFSTNLSDAMAREMGTPTIAEKQAAQQKQQMDAMRGQGEMEERQARMRNLNADNARADAFLRLQEEAAKRAAQPKPDVYEERTALADKLGLTGDRRLRFIAESKLGDENKPAGAQTEAAKIGDRQKLATQLGYKPGTRAYRNFLAGRNVEGEPKAAGGAGGGGSSTAQNWAARLLDPNDNVTFKDVPSKERSGVISAMGGQQMPRKTTTGAELDKKANLDVMLQDINTLSELAGTKEGAASVGPVSGRWSAAKQNWIGGQPPSATHLHQIAKNLSDQLLRARSGAAISPGEYQRLLAIVPDPNTPLSTFMQRLEGFQTELKRIQGARYSGVEGKEPPEELKNSVAPSGWDNFTPKSGRAR